MRHTMFFLSTYIIKYQSFKLAAHSVFDSLIMPSSEHDFQTEGKRRWASGSSFHILHTVHKSTAAKLGLVFNSDFP